jgi:hypothetical protein
MNSKQRRRYRRTEPNTRGRRKYQCTAPASWLGAITALGRSSCGARGAESHGLALAIEAGLASLGYAPGEPAVESSPLQCPLPWGAP